MSYLGPYLHQVPSLTDQCASTSICNLQGLCSTPLLSPRQEVIAVHVYAEETPPQAAILTTGLTFYTYWHCFDNINYVGQKGLVWLQPATSNVSLDGGPMSLWALDPHLSIICLGSSAHSLKRS